MRVSLARAAVAAFAFALAVLSDATARAQAPGSFLVGPGASGEYAVGESGEDLLLVQLRPGGQAWVAWLDHDEDGRARRKEGTGAVLGNRIVIHELTVPSRLPPDAGEQPESAGQVWGSLVLTFDSCGAGRRRGGDGEADGYL